MLPEETTGVEETVSSEETTGTEPEINAETSIEDIIASRSEEAEPSEESPSSEDEQSDKTAEVEKTETEEVGTEEKSGDEVVDGDPIPWGRFHKVNEEKKTYKADLEKSKADLEEARTALNDPDVMRVVMQKKGYTEDAINNYMQEKGMDTEISKAETKEYDLNTVEGWKATIADTVQQEVQKAINPVKTKLSEHDQKIQQEAVREQEAKEVEQVKTLAKDRFGIEFGDMNKDAKNLDTAVGIMNDYLDKNPKDEGLGLVRTLKLAMAEQAPRKAEERGVKKEKERQKALKSASMEGDTTVVTEETPQADWSEQRIIEWRDAHR